MVTPAFACTVCKLEHHDFVSPGIFADEFLDKHPCKWMKQALITVEEAKET